MNEPTYEKFINVLFTRLCHNLQINEKDLNSLPKADPKIVEKYKFYYEHEKAKEDFFKEKMRPVLEKKFNEELEKYLKTKN